MYNYSLSLIQEKDSAVCRLTDEKNCLANKVAALQCRLETETTQLTQQLTEVRYRLESDVSKTNEESLKLLVFSIFCYYLNDVRYTDETTLLLGSRSSLQNIILAVKSCSEDENLSLNAKKT